MNRVGVLHLFAGSAQTLHHANSERNLHFMGRIGLDEKRTYRTRYLICRFGVYKHGKININDRVDDFVG